MAVRFPLTDSGWTDLGPLPLNVHSLSVRPVFVALAASAPSGNVSDVDVLVSGETRPFATGVTNDRAYARSASDIGAVFVTPAAILSVADPALATTNTTLGSILAKLGAVVLAAGTAVIGKVGLQVGGSDVTKTNPVQVAPADFGGLAIPFGRYVEQVVLTADTLSRVSIPSGKTKAQFALDGDFYMRVGVATTAFSLPTVTTSDGSGAEYSPSARDLSGFLSDGMTPPTHICLRAPAACKGSIVFS